MEKRRSITTLVAMLLIVGTAATALALGARPNLGLDLQGGISAIYTPQLPEGAEEPDDYLEVLDETIEVIRARIDSLGVAEPDISRQGTDVLVQLPGVTDADRLREIIGTTAQLEFRPVIDVLSPDQPGYDEGPDCTAPVDERPRLAEDETGLVCGAVDADAVADGDAEQPLPRKYEVGPTALTGDRIDDARPTIDQSGFAVSLDLDRAGGEAFAAITAELACERDQLQVGLLAIVMDGTVESAPHMAEGVLCGVGITGGTAQITTGATAEGDGEDEAQDLALILRAGALPLTLEPSTFQTVSATLGEDSLRSGILAGGIGLLLVGIWLVFFYKALGVVALAGLTVFGVLLGGVIAGLGEIAGFALTLAGIAGIIVAIGITADSSIIYFERIRDEVNLGKTPRTAVRKGFTSAFRTNLAGNTVTLAAATILYLLAIGPVRGFALMLGIATLIDLLILGLFTRPVVELLARTKLITRRSLRAVERPARGAPVEATGGVR